MWMLRWWRRRWGAPASAPPPTSTPALGRTSLIVGPSRSGVTIAKSRTTLMITS